MNEWIIAGILHNDEPVAVKSLRDGGSMTMEEFRKEAETMHKLRHKNLVALLAICEDSGQIYIITEKMSKGALLTLLRGDTGNTIKTISFKDLMHMAIQVGFYSEVSYANISNTLLTAHEGHLDYFRARRLPVSRLLM